MRRPAPPVALDDPELQQAAASVARISGVAYACGTGATGSGFVLARGPARHQRARRRGRRHARSSNCPGREAREGRIVYFDPIDDIAVVAVDGLGGTPLAVAGLLAPGTAAAVQGYPHGGPFESVAATVLSVGTVPVPDVYDETAAPREIYSLEADVRPGNSGGPLLTDDGEVAGIVFARGVDSDARGLRDHDDGARSRARRHRRDGRRGLIGALHGLSDAARYAGRATEDRPNDPRGRASTASSSGTEGASLPANLSGPVYRGVPAALESDFERAPTLGNPPKVKARSIPSHSTGCRRRNSQAHDRGGVLRRHPASARSPTGELMTDPRTTPLHERHEALGASFTDFGGWLMPVRYSSDLAEHHAVRTAAGLFDISHMAEFLVEGPEAGAFLDYALAGRLSTLADDQAKYSLLLDVDGGIIDDVIVYRHSAERYMVVANAGNRDAVAPALVERSLGFDVEVDDATDHIALIAVQGPAAQAIVEADDRHHRHPPAARRAEVLPHDARGVRRGGRRRRAGAHRPHRLHRRGRLRALHPRLVGARAVGRAARRGRSRTGSFPAGLAARDTLRLEAGMPLYGHELSRDIVPAQAGLGRVVAADKDDFVGRAGLSAVVASRGSGARRPRLGGQTRRTRRATPSTTATPRWARSRAERSAPRSAIRSPWPSSRRA